MIGLRLVSCFFYLLLPCVLFSADKIYNECSVTNFQNCSIGKIEKGNRTELRKIYKAIDELKETKQNDSREVKTINSLLSKKKYADALPLVEIREVYAKKIYLDSQYDYATTLHSLGMVYIEMSKFDEALVKLNLANSLKPKDANIVTGIATSYRKLAEINDRDDYWKKACENFTLLERISAVNNDNVSLFNSKYGKIQTCETTENYTSLNKGNDLLDAAGIILLLKPQDKALLATLYHNAYQFLIKDVENDKVSQNSIILPKMRTAFKSLLLAEQYGSEPLHPNLYHSLSDFFLSIYDIKNAAANKEKECRAIKTYYREYIGTYPTCLNDLRILEEKNNTTN